MGSKRRRKYHTWITAWICLIICGKNTLEQEAPLASRLRPRSLEEIVGQRHILGNDKLLYRAIKADKLSSLIFYGPPGTGKTTIAG